MKSKNIQRVSFEFYPIIFQPRILLFGPPSVMNMERPTGRYGEVRHDMSVAPYRSYSFVAYSLFRLKQLKMFCSTHSIDAHKPNFHFGSKEKSLFQSIRVFQPVNTLSFFILFYIFSSYLIFANCNIYFHFCSLVCLS